MRRQSPEEVARWRARSKPLQRGPGPTRTASLTNRRSALPARSKAYADYYRDVRVPIVRDSVDDVGACQFPMLLDLAGEDDAVGCGGPLTVHERRRRGQNGSLEHPDNLVVACARHNDHAANVGRGSAEHRAGLVVFEGDAGYDALGARRGERKQR